MDVSTGVLVAPRTGQIQDHTCMEIEDVLGISSSSFPSSSQESFVVPRHCPLCLALFSCLRRAHSTIIPDVISNSIE